MARNTLIVSRPSVGKTNKAIELYIDKIISNINGAYFSLEINKNLLMNRILQTSKNKNIKLSQSKIKNLYVTDKCLSIKDMINYLDDVSDKLQFIIIDYLQLINGNSQLEEVFNYCSKKDIDVILLSQLKRGIENKETSWSNAILELAISNKCFLKYIDDGYFLTKFCSEIYSNDIKNIAKIRINTTIKKIETTVDKVLIQGELEYSSKDFTIRLIKPFKGSSVGHLPYAISAKYVYEKSENSNVIEVELFDKSKDILKKIYLGEIK